MDRMRTLGLYLLVVLVAVYAGIKAYVYFSVQGELDALASRLRPFAQFSYDGIASGLQGSVAVEGVEIRSSGLPLPVRIARVSLEGPGPGFLFDAAAGFGVERIPSWMRLTLQGAELSDVRDLLPADLGSAAGGRPPPCSLSGLLQRATAFQGERLPVVLDVTLEYRIDLLEGLGQLDFEYQLADGDALGIEVNVSRLSPPGSMLVGALPRIDRIRVALRPDPERVRGLVRDCAGKDRLTAGAFLDSLLARAPEQLVEDLGFLPGPGLRAALRRGLARPGETVLELGPIDDPMVLQPEVATLTPEQLIERLGVVLEVNGEPVEDLSFATADSVPVGSSRASASPGDAGRVPRRKRVRARMLDTPVAELKTYLGREARIFVDNRPRPHKGILSAVQQDQISVEQRLLGGKMTVHLPLKEVVRAQVKRYPDAGEG
jgi:hypothetical protein